MLHLREHIEDSVKGPGNAVVKYKVNYAHEWKVMCTAAPDNKLSAVATSSNAPGHPGSAYVVDHMWDPKNLYPTLSFSAKEESPSASGTRSVHLATVRLAASVGGLRASTGR